jgi:Kef-type K+ transport system membrane component KefB
LFAAWLPRRVLPAVVVEILLGMAAGTSGFGFIAPNATLDMLGLLGFAALMFVSGIEIDLKILTRNAGARPLLPFSG